MDEPKTKEGNDSLIEKLWVDVETTGLDPQRCSIIQLAALYKGEEFNMYCLPDEKPDDFSRIEEITGITWDFLEENGVPDDALYENFHFLIDKVVNRYDKKDKLIFSGYNTRFDYNFMWSLFERNKDKFLGSYFFSAILDVMSSVANEICAGRLELLNNYKLETVCNAYGIEFKAHSALEDIKATKELYEKIMEASIGSA